MGTYPGASGPLAGLGIPDAGADADADASAGAGAGAGADADTNAEAEPGTDPEADGAFEAGLLAFVVLDATKVRDPFDDSC